MARHQRAAFAPEPILLPAQSWVSDYPSASDYALASGSLPRGKPPHRDQPDHHLSYGQRHLPPGPTSLRSGDTPPADFALRSAASPPPPRERRPPRKRYPVPPGYPPGSEHRRAGAGPGRPSYPGPAVVRSPRY